MIQPVTEPFERQGLVIDEPTCLADVAPEAVEFVFEPYVPLGKVTMAQGDPGDGKTFLALALSAAITRGWGLPGSLPRVGPANVLYLTAEDGLADTIRPRLDAMGADVGRVFTYPAEDVIGVASHPKRLEAWVARTGAVLVVGDTLSALLGAETDMYRPNEVRPVMAALAEIAEGQRCAFLINRHLNKQASSRSAYRGQGSIDFTGAARSVLLIGRDPKNPAVRVLVHDKSNLSPQGPSLAFEIRDGVFTWLGPVETSAADLLSPDRTPDEQDADQEAVQFLRELLTDGEIPADELAKEAKRLGIGDRALKRARRTLSVKARRESVPHGRRGEGRWIVSLPTREAPVELVEPVEGNGRSEQLDQAVQDVQGSLNQGADTVGPLATTRVAEGMRS